MEKGFSMFLLFFKIGKKSFISMYSFIHSFSKQLLNTFYVHGMVLVALRIKYCLQEIWILV